MRVILGEPGSGTLVEGEIPDEEAANLAAMRQHVGAKYLEAAPLLLGAGRPATPEHVVWLAEEGLFNPAEGFWKHHWSPIAYAGPFVITGLAGGDPRAATVGVDEVRGAIEMYGARLTINAETPRTDVEGMIVATIQRTL